MGNSETEAADIAQFSEGELLNRIKKLEEKLESQESLKEQLRKLENHVSKLLLHEASSGSVITGSISSIPNIKVSATEIDEISILSEKENKPRQKRTPQSRIPDQNSEVPERDTEEIKEIKSAPNNCSRSVKPARMRNPGISSEHKVETVKLPSQFEQLKSLLYQEKKKSHFMQQELENCRSECNVMRKKLKHMKDEQDEMKQCHLALLNKAISASSCHKKNLQQLVAYIRNENKELRKKLTIQHFIQSGNYTMTQLLIDAGDDINAADYAGFTPLHDVAGGGYIEMAELLLDAGADMNAQATGGITPLHQAAMYGHLEMCQLLISKGCAVDQRSEFNSTPLHYAAENGHLEVVKFLIQCGANVNAEDISGVTPFEDATRAGHISVAMCIAQNFSDEEQQVCYCGQPFD